jgi:predicted small metal-binding protein
MKQIACADMGGPATCTFSVTAATPEQAVDKMMGHVKTAHPDLAADIKKMSSEETSKWMEDFKKQFAAAPEM